eukprot:36867_1
MDNTPARKQLLSLHKSVLIKKCKKHNLATQGTKKELVDRILFTQNEAQKIKNKAKTLYIHRFVELQCLIESSTKLSAKIKLPSQIDWKLNLHSILKRIQNKFECLSNMDKSHWLLTTNNIIINKEDPIKFGKLMSTQIPPPAIIQITKTKPRSVHHYKTHPNSVFKINYKASFLQWMPKSYINGVYDWHYNYKNLVNKISIHFQLHEKSFQLHDDEKCEINDGDDLYAIWNLMFNENNNISIPIMLEITPSSIHNYHRKTHSSDIEINDINDITNQLINDMELQEINSLKCVLDKGEQKYDKLISKNTTANYVQASDFVMDWGKICNGIRHEMWPKLASAVRAIINNKKTKVEQNDLSNDCIDKVINILKQERHLAVEERQYLRRTLQRASHFVPISANNKETQNNMELFKDETGLGVLMLMDIFDFHRLFTFFNFNFIEYSGNDYEKDINERAPRKLGRSVIEKCVNNIKLRQRQKLYPEYIVNDCMFRIFDYHFGVSLFVNSLKNNLHIDNGSCMQIKSVIIPKSVSSIYDDNLVFAFNIGRIEQYLSNKEIFDFYKIKLDSEETINQMTIVEEINKLYCVDDIKNNIDNLLIIIDRRYHKKSKYDTLYVFPYKNDQ